MNALRLGFGCLVLILPFLTGCNKTMQEYVELTRGAAATAVVTLSGSGPAGAFAYLSSSNFTITVANSSASATATGLTFTGDSQCAQVSTTCTSSLAPGATCTVTMSFTAANAGALTCTATALYSINGASSTSTLAVNATATYPGSLAVQKVYPTNGAGWNDYVKRTDFSKSENSQADVACAPTGTTQFKDCVHAGEKLKIRTGKTTCAGLTLTETLGVFQWTCDASSGEAIFYSNQFAMGKGLKHLLNATSWKSNSVSISLGATQIVTSPSTTWWTDAVQVLPDASAAGVPLSTAGVIYTYSADQLSKGYTISADKIGIVALNGSKIIYSAGTGSVIFGTATKHSWIEANFQGGTAVYLTAAISVSRIHRSVFMNGVYGVSNSIVGSFIGTTISDSRFAKMTQVGFRNDASSKGNLFWNSTFTSVNSYCIDAWSADGSKYIQVLCAGSSNAGIHTKYGGSFAAVSIYSANFRALDQDYVAYGSFVHNAVLANSGTGLAGYRLGFDLSQLYSNIAAVGNTTSEINFSVDTMDTQKNKFTGHTLVGSANCSALGPANINAGIDHGTCTLTGSDLSSTYTAGSISTAVLHTGISLNSAVTGQSLDATNAQGGAAFTAFASITDWVNFDTLYRGWGIYRAGGVMDSTSRASCTSGNCSIWDYALGPTSPFKNATGNGTNGSSPAFVNGAACPSIVSGNTLTMTLETTPRPFLTNAIEVPISPVGNHDGLCESGEVCIYTPNYGADQGRGDFWTNTCSFQNGTITNVKMYAYPL